jgi:cytochrome c peroxidase
MLGLALAAEPIAYAASLDALKRLYLRPDQIPFPADNPYSDAKADLGSLLFFDPRLSANGSMSCATCHNPSLGWQDGQKAAIGVHGNALARSTPTILDLAWAGPLMWDGRRDELEDQVSGPITAPTEMDGSVTQAVQLVSSLPVYRRLYARAYGKAPVSFDRLAQAISTFERTEVSNRSPFDRWIDGETNILSAPARRGFELFNGRANCAACHSGWRFTDDGFHDIGLPDGDLGRGRIVTDESILQHAFKTPTLRNVAQRAPYMHNGSLPALRAVIEHYNAGFVERASLSPDVKPLGLSSQDVDDLVAFLSTLTSNDDAVTVPSLPTKDDDR